MREVWEEHPRQYICPERRHYERITTVELGKTAQQFFEAVKEEYLSKVIPDIEWTGGEVVEIDDGLRPYRFYVYSDALVIPVDGYSWRGGGR